MTSTLKVRAFILLAVIMAFALWASSTAAQTSPFPPFTGELPTGGGVALVSTSADATPDQLVAASVLAGCEADSIWVSGDGVLIGYVVGAPSFVNGSFPGNVSGGSPLLIVCGAPAPDLVAAPGLSCPLLPADNIWNARVDGLPIHSQSSIWVSTIGANANAHPDFGSGEWPPGSGSPIGIPYLEVNGVPKVAVSFGYSDESDPGR